MQAHISLYKTEIYMWLLSSIVLELESWLSVYVCACVQVHVTKSAVFLLLCIFFPTDLAKKPFRHTATSKLLLGLYTSELKSVLLKTILGWSNSMKQDHAARNCVL